MNEDITTIVIDFGSNTLRIGSSINGYQPDYCFPSNVGKIFGDDLYSENPKITYHNPISKSGINWNAFEDLLDFAIKKEFEKLGEIELEQCRVICTVPFRYIDDNDDNTSRKIKLQNAMDEQSSKIKQLLNEKYNFTHVYVISDAELSFKASGKPSGIIMQIGHQVTTVLAIINNEIKGIEIVNLGGIDIINYLNNEIENEEIDIKTPLGLKKANEFVRENCKAIPGTIEGEYIPSSSNNKEDHNNQNNDEDNPKPIKFEFVKKNAAIAKRFSKIVPENSSANNEDHTTASSNRYSAAVDVIFQPPGEKYISGISDYIYKAIMQVENIQYHPLLYANIIISGGVVNIKGIKQKVLSNLYKFAPKGAEINITDPFENDRKSEEDEIVKSTDLSAFVGGVKLADDPDFWLIDKNDKQDQFIKFRNKKFSITSRSSVRF